MISVLFFFRVGITDLSKRIYRKNTILSEILFDILLNVANVV